MSSAQKKHPSLSDRGDPFDKTFDELAEALLARWHVPGISIAVVNNGKVYSKGYGLARFPDVHAVPETLYFGGSTTKAMVAACLGMAIHDQDRIKHGPNDGKALSWQTPLKAVLADDFDLEDKCASTNIALEDALSHRSGLPGHDNIYGPYIGDRSSGITKLVKYLGPLLQPFRTAFQYNNLMYAVAGDVLERISGLSCGDVVKQWLWEPLGMERSFWHLREIFGNTNVDVEKHMSRGYYWVGGLGIADQGGLKRDYYIPEKLIDFAGVAPAGATLSSVLDYSKWIQALLDAAYGARPGCDPSPTTSEAERPPSSSPLSSKLFTELTTPRITTVLPSFLSNSQLYPSLYSLGWAIPPTGLNILHPVIAHGGGLNGYGTSLFILPNDQYGVVAMGNTGGTSNIVGTLLCNELLVRHLGLKRTGKEQELEVFQRLMTMDLDLDEEDEARPASLLVTAPKEPANIGLKLEDFHTKQSDADMLKVLRRFEGIYYNPAYGNFRVAVAPASYDADSAGEGIQLRNMRHKSSKPKDQPLNSVKDGIRSQTYSLQVDPVGARTWIFSYLLHPRKCTDCGYKGQTQMQDFDQENLFGHGFTDDDVVGGVPTGAENDTQGLVRKENVWELITWTRLGAVFVDCEEAKLKLGMTLAVELLSKDAGREDGWEEKMIWFERVGS